MADQLIITPPAPVQRALVVLTDAGYAAYIVGERDYDAACKKYEEDKVSYQKVAVRITAILINAK